MKRVITLIASERLGGIKNAKDGSREFVTIIACIFIIGKTFPSLLVYKGSNNDLQSSWVKNVIKELNTYFTSIENR